MPELEEINKIEIRSEEYQEVLGAAPSWLLRSGITVILAVVVTIIVGSWFFKYPDILVSQVTIVTQNPPVQLKSFATGKITNLFYVENELVEKDSLIAVIENTADLNDIILVSAILDTLKDIKYFPDSLSVNLGELQQSWSSLVRIISSYRNFTELDYYGKKNESILRQISDYNRYYSGLQSQIKIMEKENEITLCQFERDKSLFNDGVYAKADFEKSEQSYLQQKRSYESSKTSLVNTQMQINQLRQQILDNDLQKANEQNTYEIQIEEALQGFKSQLSKWEQTYLIISPVDGRVTYNKVWSENQTVGAGELVATIIPIAATTIIGKADIPSAGIGKLRAGQKVNIKLDNYPYMEFGMLRGTIKNISLVPVSSDQGIYYTAEIQLDSSLVSNYNKSIPFSQNMTGTAEIITDDLRLLERFMNPIKALWKDRVE